MTGGLLSWQGSDVKIAVVCSQKVIVAAAAAAVDGGGGDV